jgi:glycosyltransferase involved in cell wall biosynthesis
MSATTPPRAETPLRWHRRGRAGIGWRRFVGDDPVSSPRRRGEEREKETAPRAPARLLFINQYYRPDHASTAQHLTDLAESLAGRGHEVHVLCSRGSYRPGEPPRARREQHRGVTIHRVQATSLGRRSMLRRYVDYLSFYVLAFVLALRLPRFDVVVSLTTPPIIGLVGTALRSLKGSRHVHWSMDLHPDAGLALGTLSRSNPLMRLFAWISDAVQRKADRVVVLGPYMADRIAAKGVRSGRIETIHVWSRREEIYPVPRRGHPLREKLGLGDRFVAMYSGNMGLAHEFGEFLEAARRLRDREDILFLFVGDGPRKREVLEAKQAEGLENIRLLDYFPRGELHQSLSLADVHLISMRREMLGIVVPCKLYGAMASSRPALFVGPEHCETADTIRASGCGFAIRLGEPDGVVAAIEALAADRERATRLGAKGRAAFLARFEREACCEQWNALIESVAGVGDPRANGRSNLAGFGREVPHE